ncbi:hypothetical protein HMI55_002868, partial [Coelomomyces lativittatus]
PNKNLPTYNEVKKIINNLDKSLNTKLLNFIATLWEKGKMLYGQEILYMKGAKTLDLSLSTQDITLGSYGLSPYVNRCSVQEFCLIVNDLFYLKKEDNKTLLTLSPDNDSPIRFRINGFPAKEYEVFFCGISIEVKEDGETDFWNLVYCTDNTCESNNDVYFYHTRLPSINTWADLYKKETLTLIVHCESEIFKDETIITTNSSIRIPLKFKSPRDRDDLELKRFEKEDLQNFLAKNSSDNKELVSTF